MIKGKAAIDIIVAGFYCGVTRVPCCCVGASARSSGVSKAITTSESYKLLVIIDLALGIQMAFLLTCKSRNHSTLAQVIVVASDMPGAVPVYATSRNPSKIIMSKKKSILLKGQGKALIPVSQIRRFQALRTKTQ